MAVAMARARVARSGFSSQPLIPAVFRRRAQEGVAALLPRLGSSPAAPAAGAGRLMHTGLGRNTNLPRKTMSMEQLSSRRSFSSRSEPRGLPWGAITYGGAIGLALGLRK